MTVMFATASCDVVFTGCWRSTAAAKAFSLPITGAALTLHTLRDA
jgi:hypothetical protein